MQANFLVPPSRRGIKIPELAPKAGWPGLDLAVFKVHLKMPGQILNQSFRRISQWITHLKS